MRKETVKKGDIFYTECLDYFAYVSDYLNRTTWKFTIVAMKPTGVKFDKSFVPKDAKWVVKDSIVIRRKINEAK